MSATKETRVNRHWATILLGLIVAAIFLVTIFSFQVKETEYAVITTLGRVSGTADPGLHLRWPYPIQNIYRFDRRVRCFEGVGGRNEESLTKDGQNVIIGIFISYKIVDPVKFYNTLVTVASAEDKLNTWMRSDKALAIGKYNFDQLINVDPEKMRLGEIEELIKDSLRTRTLEAYGIDIINVGFNNMTIPESTTEAVFKRMVAERNKVSRRYRSEGEFQAEEIKTRADSARMRILTDANAKAKTIRAEGDAQAAKYYAEFNKNPALAAFLRKIDSMKKIMGQKTTLILDTNSAPFDILRMGAENISVGDDK